jgi:hypothetical protein
VTDAHHVCKRKPSYFIALFLRNGEVSANLSAIVHRLCVHAGARMFVAKIRAFRIGPDVARTCAHEPRSVLPADQRDIPRALRRARRGDRRPNDDQAKIAEIIKGEGVVQTDWDAAKKVDRAHAGHELMGKVATAFMPLYQGGAREEARWQGDGKLRGLRRCERGDQGVRLRGRAQGVQGIVDGTGRRSRVTGPRRWPRE